MKVVVLSAFVLVATLVSGDMYDYHEYEYMDYARGAMGDDMYDEGHYYEMDAQMEKENKAGNVEGKGPKTGVQGSTPGTGSKGSSTGTGFQGSNTVTGAFGGKGGASGDKGGAFGDKGGGASGDKGGGSGEKDAIKREDLATPMDSVELAYHLMHSGFDLYTKRPISIYKLIKNYLRATSGSGRWHLLRLLNILDDDDDYYITSTEFVQHFGPVAADPEDAMKMIFLLYDLDEDGVITKYEWAQTLMLQSETEVSMMDIWKETSQEFHNKDVNEDGLVDMFEFAMHELYEIAYAIGNDIEGGVEQ